MRRRIDCWIFLSAVTLTLAGCPGADPNDNVGGDPRPREKLAVSVSGPGSDISVGSDTVVPIIWSAANDTGVTGQATIVVQALSTLAETTIADGVAVGRSTGRITTNWSTAGFAGGSYRVRVRVRAGDLTRESTAGGVVTVDIAPTFTFLAPLTDVVLPDDDPIKIEYNGVDPENRGRVTFFVDPDDTSTTDNRIQISGERELNDQDDDPTLTFDWGGNDNSNQRVANGTYSIIAVVTDGTNPEQVFVAPGRVTVPAPPPDPKPLGFAAPEDDTTFLETDAPLLFTLDVDNREEALISLAIDTDDTHTNGNEITILSQRLIAEDTPTTDFEWDGTNDLGDPVAPGIYRPFIISSTGSGTPTIKAAEFLVFRRANADQPLIAITSPSSVVSANFGSFVNIAWRDDDPTDSALIRLTIDDDPNPDEAVETDEPEIEILVNRTAGADGVLDTFAWQVPNTIPPGNYYVFAYIDSDPNTAGADHINVGPAQIRVIDPANPPD
jgi:flagellar hook assembly protein FlgD